MEVFIFQNTEVPIIFPDQSRRRLPGKREVLPGRGLRARHRFTTPLSSPGPAISGRRRQETGDFLRN